MKNYTVLEEKELVALAQNEEDELAFEELLGRNKEKIFCWVVSFVKNNKYLAEDIFQIACFKAWKYFPKFRGDSKFSTWVCNIARNAFYDHYRAKSRKPEVSFEHLLEIQEDRGAPMEYSVLGTADHERGRSSDSHHYISRINKVLNKLDEKHRIPLEMFIKDGMEYREIAKKLNCPVGTVMSRIFYGRKKAQRALTSMKNELFI